MHEPEARWLSFADDDELSDDIEQDPRWEVQPRLDEDESEGGRHTAFAALLGIILVLALVAWLVLDTSPAI